ncbi:hypothetical protein [Motiliproteus sediminis]|uniref:hypothetical protein n=1 Tax=Motiliproteus sediminis TaxID=1468178 RepID=UPI001AEFB930|nr:hypothetical protein [Motiliproteus sediminis]
MIRIRNIGRQKHHRRVRLWLLVATLLLPLRTFAAGLLIVPSQSAQPYLEVIDRLVGALQDSAFEIDIMPAAALSRQRLQQAQLVIPLGVDALDQVLSLETRTAVLAAMVPRESFQTLTRGLPEQSTAIERRQLSALYLEQPYWRQLKLARLIAPAGQHLGVLLGPHHSPHQARLADQLNRSGWTPKLYPLGENDNPLAVIRQLVSANDLLLAIPDRADFNRNTARWLLTLSLRERIPLIGFSRRYVEAGATASVFSSPATIAAETAAIAAAWLQDEARRLPPPAFPQRFDISLNPGIAARLGLDLPSPTSLEQALQQEDAP